jgi:signal transduction histidine kinase
LNGQVEVRVSDAGIGIPLEDMGKIFDKFFQVDSTLTREAGGTGLGLAICKGIIGAHKGKIWAESELGKGSTFIITLEKWSG